MKEIDLEGTIFLHLMACNVPESAIRIVRAEKSDIVTVIVQAPHGRKIRDYSAFQLLNGKPYVVDEMISIADWYHGHPALLQRETSWHAQEWWRKVLWSLFVGLTLIVLLELAKHFGL